MAQEIINVGTGDNRGTGEPLRSAMVKSNNNFTELYNKATFTFVSDDTFVIPIDTTPSHMTGLLYIGSLKGVTIDTATGSAVNSSGRSLNMTGTLAFQLERVSQGDVTLWFYSERSNDGINWAKNINSLREIVVSKDGIDYKSGFSFTQNTWQDGEYLRFQFCCSDSLKLKFLQRSKVIGLDSVLSHSLIWNMSEH